MAAGGSSPSPQELQQVMAEVERMGAVDPRAQAQLLEELKQVEPSLWPMAVKSVWSRVAYAQRFNQEQQAKHLADRRSARIDRRRQDINVREGYPAGYPATAAVPYPTTAAVAESPLPNIETLASPDGSPPAATTAPTVRPQHDGYRDGYNTQSPTLPRAAPTPNGNTRGVAPPQPGQGAALDSADRHTAAAAKARPSEVVQTAYHAEVPEDVAPPKHGGTSDVGWKAHLAEAITDLESRLADASSGTNGPKDDGNKADDAKDDDPRSADHARLRMMQLLAGRRGDALAEMPVDDTAVRDFWAKELFGLDILLDTQRTSRGRRRAAEAKRHLSDAVLSLGETAALEVRNMAFCRKVQSYGSVERFEKREFSPGQRLLLYAEIDNFRSENTAKGYHTSLRSSFHIFDSSGCRVDKRESTTTEEYCLSPRRDYFIGCDFCLPAGINPGRHTLKLTVEDLKSHKVGESSIDFTVVKR